ncbi:3-dehydroquinate synthase [uncultured archaeon]|nr:3-dehydroquinate synthase [uncultured archaeon]
MNTVTVRLGKRSYPIYIGEGTLNQLGEFAAKKISPGRCAIITSAPIARHHLKPAVKSLTSAGFTPIIIEIPDGEQHKNLATYLAVIDELVKAKLDRTSTLFALGGGVVGDITGFAAATYLRGVPYVQIPTTLLAQVDSSVGGKTGVDHPQAKNLIGAFNQPTLVITDTKTLTTLPEREYTSGLAEIIKYGIIASPKLFKHLETHKKQITQRNPKTLEHIITESCKIKAHIVAADEKDAGIRQTLNFGHTIGHAIEAASGYKNIRHGEAVALGMIAATKISEDAGLTQTEAERIKKLIANLNLPTKTNVNITKTLTAISHDKKRSDGKTRFIAAQKIGSTCIIENVPKNTIQKALKSIVK